MENPQVNRKVRSKEAAQAQWDSLPSVYRQCAQDLYGLLGFIPSSVTV